MKIKVFDCGSEKDLENDINEFIQKSKIDIIDIKFSTSHFKTDIDTQIYCFSALVIYKPEDTSDEDFERIVHPENYYIGE